MRQPDPQLARLARYKQVDHPIPASLGPEMIAFFKSSIAKRQTKFAKIADCWSTLVPSTLSDHCALESLHRGSLTVIVDSASHLYELKQLLLAGLEKQLMLACKSAGLRKINLRRGQWYDDVRNVRFDA